MRAGHNRFKKPDILLIVALVVGIGAVVSTSVQAGERQQTERSALMVSYKGALPALRQRLALAAKGADKALRQVKGLLPDQQAAAQFFVPAAQAPQQMYMGFEAPTPEPEVRRLHASDGFAVEEDFVPTLIFQQRW